MNIEQIDYAISEIEGAALEGEHDEATRLIDQLEKNLGSQQVDTKTNERLMEAYTLAEQAALPADERDERYSWL